MWSKNAKHKTLSEDAHIERVKSLPCSVCSAPPPSDAHHIVQGLHFATVALCKDCHQGSVNGWHGNRRIWAVMKMDEIRALNETLRALAES